MRLILVLTRARRLKKPQPRFGPHDVPLRRSYLLLADGNALTTNMSLAFQVRLLVIGSSMSRSSGRRLAMERATSTRQTVAIPGDKERKREVRARQWQALPRELKLAIKRVRVNFGHAATPARASDVAVKACRLFRCPECARLQEPAIPRPSKLPVADEFNMPSLAWTCLKRKMPKTNLGPS